MRLIEANGVKNSLLTDLLLGVDGGTDDSYLKTYEVIDRIEKIVNECVDKEPTVKAIPIEWLNLYTTSLIFSDDYVDNADSIDDYIYCIKEMMRDWEKENGTEESTRNI